MERLKLLFRSLTTVAILSTTFFPLSTLANEASLNLLLDNAKAELRENNPEGAYQLLAAEEAEHTGSDAFDYLLGLAALDSGRAGEAIFSLQRLAVRNPDFAGARLELARAYFEVGDNELARSEFERLREENPPANVTAMINNYMDAIDSRARAYSTTLQYYVDVGSGFDDNPAAATADDQFLSFILNDKNVQQSSPYADAAIGAIYSKPLTPATSLIMTGRVAHRTNTAAHYVDPTTADIAAMLNWKKDANRASIGLTGLLFRLDGEANKQDVGISASYSRQLGDKLSVDLYGRTGEMRFEEELEIQDVDQWMGGAGITFTGEASQFTLGGFYAEDDAVDDASPFSNETTGIRSTAAWIFPGGRSLSLEAMAMETEFEENFFGFEREDELISVVAGMTWEQVPTKDWTFTFRIGWSQKDSTVSLYEFDRLEFGFVLRRIINQGRSSR